MRPDQQALWEDLRSPTFRVGERKGRWALKGLRFPHVLCFVEAAQVAGGPSGFLLRTECSGYPAMTEEQRNMAAAAAKARELHLSGMTLNGGVGRGGY